MKILIVNAGSSSLKYQLVDMDGEKLMAKGLVERIGIEGSKLTQKVNGQEAWDYLKVLRDRCEAEDRPISDFVHGIITDIEMPGMDGLALCKLVKEDRILKNLPVAIFSSMINEPLARKCQVVGADVQYTKPDLKVLSVKLYDLVTQAWG